MEKMRYVLVLLMLVLTACFHGEEDNPLVGTGRVDVYKYDGSLQCETFDKAQSLEDMRMALVNAGIDVISIACGTDGLMYATVCGGGTGQINIYTIHEQNLADAEALGFASLSLLPDHQKIACP